MDEFLKRLVKFTDDFCQRIDDISHEELTRFIEQREFMIETMKNSTQNSQIDKSYRREIEHLMLLDKRIAKKIIDFRDEASKELEKLQLVQKQKQAYDTGVPLDSLFFDRKN